MSEEPTTLALAEREPQSIEGLIALAIKHGAAVEPLERLMAMRLTLKAEAAQEAFLEALSAFQSECPVIHKRKVATVTSQTGGSYQYRYAPLEDIVKATSPIMRRHGLSYRFDTRFETEPAAIVVICVASHRDGHAEISEFRSPIDQGARMNVMQRSASSLTYAKRYAFCNAFGILTGDEDDDGQGSGSGGGPQTARVAPVRTQPVAPDKPTHSPPVPRPVGKNLVPLKRVSRAQDSDGPTPTSPSPYEQTPVAETPAPSTLASVLDAAQTVVERAAMLEVAERRQQGLDLLPEEVIVKRAQARCNDRLKKLYGKTLETASLMELEALGRIIDRAMAKLEAP